jgi:heat-inducible transcriptional repressor
MELDQRKQMVLRAIVTEYVRSAEPVGSERLAESHEFSAKAATIRNEMAALAQLGYLVQPHTSAGRIPSDKGYRFYVDRLMGMDVVRPHVPRARFRAELDEVLRQTCRILAGLTHCAAVATPPQSEAVTLQQIHVTPVTASRILLVVLLSSGEVEHRILEFGDAVPATTLTRISNLLNEQLSGLPLEAARRTRPVIPVEMAGLEMLVGGLRDAVADTLRRDLAQEAVLEGTTQVLREPEFHDDVRRERLLRALENRREVLESLRALDQGVDVTIGTENPLPTMQEFSFVSSRYYVGSHMTGVIGVFGPTSMAYSHTIPAVRSVARTLGEVLTRLSAEE